MKLFEEEKVMHDLRAMQQGKTQRALAGELGITEQHLSDIYRGTRPLRGEALARVGYRKRTLYERVNGSTR